MKSIVENYSYLKLCFELDKKIFDYAQVGMRLSDITKFVINLYQENNLTNNIASYSLLNNQDN